MDTPESAGEEWRSFRPIMQEIKKLHTARAERDILNSLLPYLLTYLLH